MSDPEHRKDALDSIAQQAAAWVLRCDRGLTAIEQDEFSAWLAADPRHGAQLARYRRHWQRLERMGLWCPEHSEQPNPDLLALPLRPRLHAAQPFSLTLAAAAALALGLFTLWQPSEIKRSPPPSSIAATKPTATDGHRVLDDGTMVELTHGTELSLQFTATERRVRLARGEAHFTVTKDAARPFIVNAGGLDVIAVGTAFNLRADPAAIEVLVTEGTVQVSSEREGSELPDRSVPPSAIAVLTARQRVVVSLSNPHIPPLIATLTPVEIERVLAWQHRLLDFNAASLSTIVAEFNRRNKTQLLLVDPVLADVRISASFRSDNIAGFVHLLEAGFGVRAEHRSESQIVLHKSR